MSPQETTKLDQPSQNIPQILESRPRGRELSDIKALVIDDEEEIVDILEFMLKRMGADVIKTTNPKIGLELLKSEHPDLIISDIMMPQMNVTQFLEEIRLMNVDPYPKILFITGANTETGLDIAYIKVHTEGVLGKPFSMDTLRERLIPISDLIIKQQSLLYCPSLPLNNKDI